MALLIELLGWVDVIVLSGLALICGYGLYLRLVGRLGEEEP